MRMWWRPNTYAFIPSRGVAREEQSKTSTNSPLALDENLPCPCPSVLRNLQSKTALRNVSTWRKTTLQKQKGTKKPAHESTQYSPNPTLEPGCAWASVGRHWLNELGTTRRRTTQLDTTRLGNTWQAWLTDWQQCTTWLTGNTDDVGFLSDDNH